MGKYAFCSCDPYPMVLDLGVFLCCWVIWCKDRLRLKLLESFFREGGTSCIAWLRAEAPGGRTALVNDTGLVLKLGRAWGVSQRRHVQVKEKRKKKEVVMVIQKDLSHLLCWQQRLRPGHFGSSSRAALLQGWVMALVLFLIIVVGTSVQLQACRLGVFFHAFGFYQLCLLRFVISLYGLNEMYKSLCAYLCLLI